VPPAKRRRRWRRAGWDWRRSLRSHQRLRIDGSDHISKVPGGSTEWRFVLLSPGGSIPRNSVHGGRRLGLETRDHLAGVIGFRLEHDPSRQLAPLDSLGVQRDGHLGGDHPVSHRDAAAAHGAASGAAASSRQWSVRRRGPARCPRSAGVAVMPGCSSARARRAARVKPAVAASATSTSRHVVIRPSLKGPFYGGESRPAQKEIAGR
jgi:hypothetical protein